jgi:hypothetical protein
MPQGIGEPGLTPLGPPSPWKPHTTRFQAGRGGRNGYLPSHGNQMQAVADNDNQDYH